MYIFDLKYSVFRWHIFVYLFCFHCKQPICTVVCQSF